MLPCYVKSHVQIGKYALCTVQLSYIYTISKLSHHTEVTETGFYIILCYIHCVKCFQLPILNITVIFCAKCITRTHWGQSSVTRFVTQENFITSSVWHPMLVTLSLVSRPAFLTPCSVLRTWEHDITCTVCTINTVMRRLTIFLFLQKTQQSHKPKLLNQN